MVQIYRSDTKSDNLGGNLNWTFIDDQLEFLEDTSSQSITVRTLHRSDGNKTDLANLLGLSSTRKEPKYYS